MRFAEPDTTAGPRWRRVMGKRRGIIIFLAAIFIIFLCQSPCLPAQDRPTETQSRKCPRHKLSETTESDQVVLRFMPDSLQQATALVDAAAALCLDIWNFSLDRVDVQVPVGLETSLLQSLPRKLRTSSVRLSPERVHDISTQADVFFENFQPLSVIEPWMRLLQSLFPTHVRLLEIGTTAQGDRIQAFRLGVHPTIRNEPTQPRKTIVVAGGVHAREWISTSTVNFVAHHFITMYGKSRSITSMLQYFDFVFIPSLNPDGYRYTWESDRLWRKNRQMTSVDGCVGMDIDRSYSFGFGGNQSDHDPCSEDYAGDAPFAVHEAQQVSTWARSVTENGSSSIVAFLDLHSYSQRILYPYSFSCGVTPPSLENLEELAIGLAKAIFTASHEKYTVESACQSNPDAVNSASLGDKGAFAGGSALDWFFHDLQVPYAYQIKLRDTGNYGFLVPPSEIIPTGREIASAIEYLALFLATQRTPGGQASAL